jgi:hypothetical protein
MNISRVCSAALEAELNLREAHLASLARYEEFKRMRGEAEVIREQMVAQTGRGWQKLAQDMQRMLKEIGREIEQLEKEIPEQLRTVPLPEPDLPEPEAAVEQLAPVPAPPPSPELKHAAKRAPKVPEPVAAAAG